MTVPAPPRGFWGALSQPFFILAPLADVTDAAFRRVIAARGKPDVFFTEFVSADGLVSPGREVLLRDLSYTEAERPIVAQLFSSRPEKMEAAAGLAARLGFDGIDINMGCPDRGVEKQGAGAALIKSPVRAGELIRAARRGVPRLPVSVKTRLGYRRAEEIEDWLPALLVAEPAAVTLHARTRDDMSKVPARWEAVRRAVAIRDSLGSATLIVGNGDAASPADAREKARASGADGVMLGRAVFGNPWLFSDRAPSLGERLETIAEHTRLFADLLGDIKPFTVMRKHYKAYLSGIPGAADLCAALMAAEDAGAVAPIIAAFLRGRDGW